MNDKEKALKQYWEENIVKRNYKDWQSSYKGFYKWSKNKYNIGDILVKQNEDAPLVYWNLKWITPKEETPKERIEAHIEEEVIEEVEVEEEEVIPEIPIVDNKKYKKLNFHPEGEDVLNIREEDVLKIPKQKGRPKGSKNKKKVIAPKIKNNTLSKNTNVGDKE